MSATLDLRFAAVRERDGYLPVGLTTGVEETAYDNWMSGPVGPAATCERCGWQGPVRQAKQQAVANAEDHRCLDA